MTWLAELKPNTALNHRGVVDGSRERKGARRQRFLIQINTEPRLSSKPLLSNRTHNGSFNTLLAKDGDRFMSLFIFYTLQTFSLFPASISEPFSAIHLFPSHLAFPEPSFHGPFIDSLPLHHLPWSPGSSFLVAQKTSVTDCLPPVRL